MCIAALGCAFQPRVDGEWRFHWTLQVLTRALGPGQRSKHISQNRMCVTASGVANELHPGVRWFRNRWPYADWTVVMGIVRVCAGLRGSVHVESHGTISGCMQHILPVGAVGAHTNCIRSNPMIRPEEDSCTPEHRLI